MGFFVTIKFIHLFPTTNKRMRTILIIGAGRSASSLIHYLLNKSVQENLHLTIGDLSQELAQRKTNNHPNATAIALDINNISQRQTEIQKADIVISRPMMTRATQAWTRSRLSKTKRAAATINLSATGSKNCPKADS